MSIFISVWNLDWNKQTNKTKMVTDIAIKRVVRVKSKMKGEKIIVEIKTPNKKI